MTASLDPGTRRTAELLQGAGFYTIELCEGGEGHSWRETGVLRDEVRRAAFPIDGVRSDPTVGWDHVRLNVDAGAQLFAVLAEDDCWVAQTIVGDVVIGIQSRRWPIDETGLRTVVDFDPCVAGAREIRKRWPS